MQIEKMERVFRYREGNSSGINLPDPDPSLAARGKSRSLTVAAL